MKKIIIISALVAVLVGCFVWYHFMQKKILFSHEPLATNGAQPAQSPSQVPVMPTGDQVKHVQEPAEPEHTDNTMGIIIYDNVKVEGVKNVKLNSGDVVHLLPDDRERPSYSKVRTKNGQVGFISNSKFLSMPVWESIDAFYYNTTPLAELFVPQEGSSAPEEIKKYDDLLHPAFLQRAQKNSDPSVSAWAKELIRLGGKPDNTTTEEIPVPEEPEPAPGT